MWRSSPIFLHVRCDLTETKLNNGGSARDLTALVSSVAFGNRAVVMGLPPQNISDAYTKFRGISAEALSHDGAGWPAQFSHEDAYKLKDKLGLSDVSSDIFTDIFLAWLSRNETCVVIFFPHQVFV